MLGQLTTGCRGAGCSGAALLDERPDQQKDQDREEPVGAHADDPRHRVDQHRSNEQGQYEKRPQAIPHFLDPGHLQVVFQVQAQQLGATLKGYHFCRLDFAICFGHGQHHVEHGQRLFRAVCQVLQFFLCVLAQDARA